jgi:hypothetical protein
MKRRTYADLSSYINNYLSQLKPDKRPNLADIIYVPVDYYIAATRTLFEQASNGNSIYLKDSCPLVNGFKILPSKFY